MKKQKTLETEYGNKKINSLVIEVLYQMPQKVGDFILKKVTFIDSQGHLEDYATTFVVPVEKKDVGFIVYLESTFFELSRQNQLYIMAEKISEIYLHRDQVLNVSNKKYLETIEFVEQYGFTLKDDSLSLLLKWSYIKRNFTPYRVLMIALILLVFLGMIYIDNIAYLFKWALFL